MLAVFHHSGLRVTSSRDVDVVHLVIELIAPP